MQTTFQKPENALRRADELINVGQSEDALAVLHGTIGHRKFRQQGWDPVQEQIITECCRLSVELNKLHIAREGLHQYRAIAQAANIGTLGKVLTEFRHFADAALQKAKQKASNVEMSELTADLEADESPDSLLLSMLQIEVRDEPAREVHQALRIVWDAHKIILDLLRTTPKLERVYHDTAKQALDFCLENARPVEFKRLCEVLRSHYGLLQKNRGKPEYEPLLRPELHLETRIAQLEAAATLELWRESYQTADDIFALGLHEQFQAGTKPKPNLLQFLATYYEKLSKIFWVSNNYLFHAQAWLRYLIHFFQFKRNRSAEEERDLASVAVLAVLCIPLKTSPTAGIDSTHELENNRKLSALLGQPTSVPSRDSLKAVILGRDLLSHCMPEIREVFTMTESNVTPLDLCSLCLPLLRSLEVNEHFAHVLLR